MKRFRGFMGSRAGSAVLLAAAVILLAVSSIGGTRAALTYRSETYASQIELKDIGVTLLENGDRVAYRDFDIDEKNSSDPWEKSGTGVLLSNMLKEGKDNEQPLKLGYAYPEVLRVQNTGNINEYVRVSIYKYWLRQDGDEWVRDARLSPDLIDLKLVNGDVWVEDVDSRTDERTVLYYTKLLKEGKKSKPFANKIVISGDVANAVTEHTTKEGNTTVTTYEYAFDGSRFMLEARVDAVQEHNADKAALSAWGRHVGIDKNNQNLTLGND